MNEYNDWVYRFTSLFKIALALTAFVFGFLVILNKTKPPQLPKQSATLKVMVAPANSTVKLNGKGITNGTYTVNPGKYTLVIKKSGFASQTQTKDITVNSTVFMGAALQSDSPSTANWYQDHQDDQRLAEGVNGVASDASSQNSINQTPLINALPVDIMINANSGFRIDIGVAPQGNLSSSPVVNITANTASERQSAMNWIKYSGYDASTATIQFIGTINPFIKPAINEGFRGE